ncbi:MAG: hypothetical protein IIW16_03300 [Clostridia bacterium]|nr:hypothetical protein [Clostridia bacterium]
MKKARIVCLLLCVLLALCGCSGDTSSDYSNGQVTQHKTDSYVMHLLYNETDSYNPYAVTTKENKELGYLLYDSLITLGTDFEPVYKIADKITLDGKVCTVSIKGVMFSDGTRLTVNDVIYSANLAKASSTVYAEQLATVESIEAVGGNIVFNLKKADPFFVNLLDFPIIKAESENIKSEDNVILPPIGAGKYVLDVKNAVLTPNKHYYGEPCKFPEIKLINAPGKESIEHYVAAGVVSVCYSDYSDNTIPRMSGRKVSVPLNNMVFIGINMSHPLLSNKYLRYAISSAVDRDEIVKEAYYGNGIVANGPFNPLWKHGEGFQTLENKSNEEISVVNLEKIGYNGKDNGGFRVNSKGKRLSLSLLVNSDNAARISVARLISQRLSQVGIELKITEVSFEQYIQRLQSGAFDLYLGEVRLLANMDITQIVTPGGSAAYGIANKNIEEEKEEKDDKNKEQEPQEIVDVTDGINLTAAAAVAGYYGGEYTLGDVASTFLSEMPLIPLMYRTGITMFTPDIKSSPTVSYCDLFIDINNYSFEN